MVLTKLGERGKLFKKVYDEFCRILRILIGEGG